MSCQKYRNAFWVFQMKIESYGNRELMHMGKLELHTGEVHIWKLRWRELETFWEWHGRPLENQAYRVVDDFGRDCPFWVEGELWIGGEGVGKGYRGDEVLTKQKYIMDCFGRWYRTGDNGCFWNDGTIEYRGRRDFQVKVKGHRIELGEIEAILNKIAGVKKSIVCAVEHNNRKNMLVAVVVKESPNINEEFLMQNLKSKLPVYMLPTKIIFEDRALNPKQQRVYMNNIGNIKSIIKLTAPHDVMISHPEEVAKILLEN